MKRSIATVCLSGSLEEKLDAAAAAGFDGVELFENDLIASPLTPRDVRERLVELGLTLDLYQPFRDFEGVAAPDFARAEAKLALMQELGAELLLVCSSVSPAARDDDALAARQLRELAERADARGMRIAYEALAWGRHVNDYEHAWRIVERADHPALGVCLDSFHILSRGTPLDAIAGIPAGKLLYLQLADAPHLVMDVLQWSRHYRCFPGQGGFDLAAFTARVLDAGYAGPLSLEVFNDVFRQADPGRMAIDAMRSLRLLEDTLTPRESVRPLPPAPWLGGYAFVELAVEPASVGATQRQLHGLGFAQSAQHRTKPVTLWTQGQARVLLNAGAGGPPGVAAVAIESGEPERSGARAEALLAPRLPRDRGPWEADLGAIAGPDGTAVFFCRTSDDGPWDWLTDFVALDPAGPPSPGYVERVDHVALSHPFDSFDEAVLFYRSILGLEPRDSLELAGPDGLIRSRAMASADRRIRLVLSVPLLADDARGAGGLQHIAFACSDVIETARGMAERGVPPLAMPGNYYDDLAACTEFDPELMGEMRELGVLYDRDGAGECLHCFAATLGGRVFFELVERRGGYDGFGAANSPIRMAAQRPAAAIAT
jgi:4-hydroxyphenylpyruvate dioxygenase